MDAELRAFDFDKLGTFDFIDRLSDSPQALQSAQNDFLPMTRGRWEHSVLMAVNNREVLVVIGAPIVMEAPARAGC